MSEKNPLFITDNHFLIGKNPKEITTVYETNIKAGKINPLARRTITRILNINSCFRENYLNTDSNNFFISLPLVKDVITMKVVDLKIPSVVHSVSEKYNSNNFTLNFDVSGIGPTNYIIDISDGTYSRQQMATAINNKFISLGLSSGLPLGTNTLIDNSMDLILEPQSTSDNLMRIRNRATSGKTFELNFNLNTNSSNCSFNNNLKNVFSFQLTLGWLLGFRGNYDLDSNPSRSQNIYKNNTSYIGNTAYLSQKFNYFLLSINDFVNNHNNTFLSPYVNEVVTDPNLIAKIHPHGTSAVASMDSIIAPTRQYFGPVDIKKLEIKIYDEFGRLLDLKKNDYSFSVELEIMYDL